jgi:DNA-directed RNA polymerase subunit K/omega
MSDIEYNDDYSDSNSDGESLHDYTKNNIVTHQKKKQNPTISNYDEDDDDDLDINNEIDEEIDDENNIETEDFEDENKNTGLQEDVENDDDDDIYEGIDDDDDNEDDDNEDDDDNNDNDDDNDSQTFTGGAKANKNKLVKQDKKVNNIQLDIENNEENYYDDDEDDQDDNYLQKFDKEITKDYVMNFHPECLNHNYDEIKALSKVTRDEFNIVIDSLHKTLPFLTKYEKTRILGQRSKQIECGAKPLIKVPENIIDSYLIAELELEQKAIPFIIRRPIPSGGSEYWNLKDLDMISF